MRRFLSICTLVATAAVLGCDDEGPATHEGADTEDFTASLTGGSGVPPVTTTASGTATLTVAGNDVAYRIQVSDIDSATAAHIHAGAAGASGGVMVGLFSGPTTPLDFSGLLVEGTVTVADSVLTRMRNGTAYVNVHTTGNPAGEIRGQVEQQE